MEKYNKLMKELPEIGKVVSSLPETVQGKAFDIIVSTLLEREQTLPVTPPISPKSDTGVPISGNDLSAIGTKASDGSFHFSVRDLKATTAWDATKRLTYVLVRAYTQIMGTETASRKNVINAHLRSWRLYDGNARKFLANDAGIIRNNDELKLDKHASDEADQFIREIADQNVTGSWKPTTKKNRKKSEDEKKS